MRRRPLSSRWLLAGAVLVLGACETTGPVPATSPQASAPSTTTAHGRRTIAIAQVQGAGARSPLEGRAVIVEGVVTGNFVAGLGGFFLQSVVDDGDPATAEGVFVQLQADAPSAPRPGQWLRVAGTVAEIGSGDASLTSLVDARFEVLGEREVTWLELSGPPDDWEALEGMAVRITAPLTVTGNDGLARFGELATSFGGRLFAPTELAAPGPAADTIAADNAHKLLRLDDGRSAPPTEQPWYLPQPWTDAHPVRSGSVVTGVQGVVDQRFGSFRLQLTDKLGAIEQASRPPAPTVAGDRRIAGFNVLNLFNGDGRGGGFPTARGAATAEEHARQLAKLVTVVQALDPDLAALSELENDGYGPDSALVQFVAALNAAGPHRDWRWVGSGQGPGDNAIRVGLIYRSSRFETVGAPAMLADGPFLDGSRVPLAQAFRAGRGPVFVVVANHFKSKGGCGEATGGDADLGDGQACFNATRVASARRLHDWLATDPTGTGASDKLIIGDLNAHAEEDPLRLLRELGWRDAFALAKAPRPYSFIWAGLSARLDHALLDAGLAARLRGAVEWHNSADESERFDYHRHRDADPWRASDHDPLLLGLDLAR